MFIYRNIYNARKDTQTTIQSSKSAEPKQYSINLYNYNKHYLQMQ